jgi:hypothetical protein
MAIRKIFGLADYIRPRKRFGFKKFDWSANGSLAMSVCFKREKRFDFLKLKEIKAFCASCDALPARCRRSGH